MISLVRLAVVICSVLLLGACAGRYKGHRGPVVDARGNVIYPAGTPPLPVLQHHDGSIPASLDSPAVKPAVIKHVWLYPRRNALGDVIGGHYVHILYKELTFADLPSGTARIPVTPRFETIEDTPPPSVPLQHQGPQAPPPAIETPKDTVPSDVMQKIEALREHYLPATRNVISFPKTRVEDGP